MNQPETVSLLQEIYQNARTAVEAIETLLSKSSASQFTASLKSQASRYREIAKSAAAQLGGFRELPAENPIFDRIGLWASLQMGTLTNHAPGHMAEIIINGSTAGIVSLTKRLHAAPQTDPAAKALAHDLLDTEQQTIRLMGSFL